MGTTITIKRFNPETEKSYLQDFSVNIEDKTILDCLLFIKDNLDDSLTFRRSCRSAICGSCAVKINGKPGLACKTHASEVIENGKIVIEPLDHLEVKKDLVVDLGPFNDAILKTMPWIIPSKKSVKVMQENSEQMNRVDDCIFCGACYSACNMVDVDKSHMGPSAFGKSFKRVFDPRDGARDQRVRTLAAEDLYKCTTCNACREVCPKKIKTPKVIEDLRAMAVQKGCGKEAHSKIAKTIESTGFALKKDGDSALEICEQRGLKIIYNGVREIFIKEFDGKPINKIALFLGCMMNLRDQEVLDAILNICKHNRIAVHVPLEQVCCGSPMLRTGMRDVAKELIAKNTKIFNAYAQDEFPIITSCPGCGLTINRDYLEYVDCKFKVYDLTEYLFGVIDFNVDDLHNLAETGTYHMPCHTRANGLEEKMYLDLLELIGVEPIQSGSSLSLCCGAGGGMFSHLPELSGKLASRRIEKMNETGSKKLFTNCSFCDRSLGAVADEDMEITNFYVLLSKSYEGRNK